MRKDLQLYQDDVKFSQDLAIVQSDTQHQECLLMTEKGEWKESPLTGVGTVKFLESEDPAGLLREIRVQFGTDGMNVKSVGFQNGQIKVEAGYDS